jgi:hypothetical protein
MLKKNTKIKSWINPYETFSNPSLLNLNFQGFPCLASSGPVAASASWEVICPLLGQWYIISTNKMI